MKKTKTQASATMTDKNNTNGNAVKNAVQTAPSDIRVKDGMERELDFKKVLYGYDPDEVKAYINEMNKTHGAAVRNYESRLSSVKEELLLSNRERDSLSAKYKECCSKETGEVAASVDKKAEDMGGKYKEALMALQTKLEQKEAERALLEKENRELKAANEAVLQAAPKCESLERELKKVSAENALLAAEVNEKENKHQALLQELEQKSEKIKALLLETEEAKRAMADFEIKNGVLAKQLEEKEAENTALKEQNKAQAYDCAEKINKLESEHSQSRLAAQKDMQLRKYFIDRAELTLAELAKQMVQIKQAFDEDGVC